MAFIVIGLVAFVVSGLTLFAGFGLGTLLLPAFALFFPVDVAVAATAIVHGLNGLFKVALLGKFADRGIVLRFGVPALLAAFAGAAVLAALTAQPIEWWRFDFFGKNAVVTPVKLVMGVLIMVFALLELVPSLRSWRAPARSLPLGGVLSGFFGGLSGHQGALRAAFITPLKLEPAAFAGTQAVLSVMVDASRIFVYGMAYRFGAIGWIETPQQVNLVVVGTLCAFAGALLGKRLLPKVTVEGIRVVTGVLLLVVGLGLGSGILG
jgi:uncharacterized membrane protein YfcA